MARTFDPRTWIYDHPRCDGTADYRRYLILYGAVLDDITFSVTRPARAAFTILWTVLGAEIEIEIDAMSLLGELAHAIEVHSKSNDWRPHPASTTGGRHLQVLFALIHCTRFLCVCDQGARPANALSEAISVLFWVAVLDDTNMPYQRPGLGRCCHLLLGSTIMLGQCF